MGKRLRKIGIFIFYIEIALDFVAQSEYNVLSVSYRRGSLTFFGKDQRSFDTPHLANIFFGRGNSL